MRVGDVSGRGRRLPRWECLGLLACLLGCSRDAPPGPSPGEAAPPGNFLVVLVDDLGLDQLRAYDDLNLYRTVGNAYPYAHTPHIDALAQRGVRFDQARAYPICSPSRAALQTGEYGLRTGCGTLVRGPSQGAESAYELGGVGQPAVDSLAMLARRAGLATGLFGKLHLQVERDDGGPGIGTGDAYACSVLGYDVFRGVRRNPNTPPHPPREPCGTHVREVAFTYYEWIEAGGDEGVTRRLVHGPAESPCEGAYLTETQMERTLDWIRGLGDRPFLAVWCTSEIHGPFQWPPVGPEGDRHGFGGQPPDGGRRERFQNTRGRAKLEYLDGALGRLFEGMEPDVLARTTVVFMGDNGSQGSFAAVQDGEVRYPIGHARHRTGDETAGFSMEPYDIERMKRTVYEPGVRVPVIVAGPAVSRPGRASAALVDVTDVHATLRELLAPPGSRLARLGDSISFADILRGEPDEAHARQFSYAAEIAPNGYGLAPELERSFYVRRDAEGNLWKLVRSKEGLDAPFRDEFYELGTDPLEETDLGRDHPEYGPTLAAYARLCGD